MKWLAKQNHGETLMEFNLHKHGLPVDCTADFSNHFDYYELNIYNRIFFNQRFFNPEKVSQLQIGRIRKNLKLQAINRCFDARTQQLQRSIEFCNSW